MSQNRNPNDSSNWPEMAAALYEKITVRNADFTCDFDNLEVQMPGAATATPLKVNGSIRLRINKAGDSPQLTFLITLSGTIDLHAQLVISFGGDQIVLVADEQYIIVNIESQQALDRIINSLSGTKGSSSSGGGFGAQLNKLRDVNQAVRNMRLMIDLRVGGRTYLVLGGKGFRITANAVIGKISSMFRR